MSQSTTSEFLFGRSSSTSACPKSKEGGEKMQTVEEIFHMNKGVGETSYAMNSDVQNNIISVGREATKKRIVQALCSSNNWPVSMAIADLGCSSGPNALRVISEITDAIYATSRLLDRPAPELVVHLNDLFGNDFNTIFASLPSFYKKMKQQNNTNNNHNNKNNNNNGSNCFVCGVPGSFYGRLFPSNSIHFVHSSSSLHWLSQVPGDILEGRALNKGKLYISKSSPQSVLNAYSMQFKNDFLNFMEIRSQELVAGGCMVLSFLGRNSLDPAEPHACYQWELLAQVLMAMVSEGLVEEEKVDSFDAPYYAPCMEEIKWVLQKEGSFILESCEAYEIDWDGGVEFHSDSFKVLSCGERVSRTIRAVVESMLESHFGSHIMDELFLRYSELVEHHLSNNRTKYINLVLSLVKKGW
ncbi:jasmonate O-methyltransferase [Arachis ipaensis]|uniref:jasmonate O-methyltransferase n=1 Tax=Arachis ipaensis TaxID=130454 RepID=UPI0007AF03C9|nr:jasmonate O-methyltransferase [Arachis ipaensis]